MPSPFSPIDGSSFGDRPILVKLCAVRDLVSAGVIEL